MTIPTIHGAEYDLLVLRGVRDRILAGDWTQGVFKDHNGHHCLSGHLGRRGEHIYSVVLEHIDAEWISPWNDTHTQAEVVALLDDVEDSLLGELGVVG